MKRIMRKTATAAGALTLAGGLVAATALPAAAEDTPQTVAVAAVSFGVINQFPLAVAEYPDGSSPVTRRFVQIRSLLTTGPAADTAGVNGALSIVTHVAATQLGHMNLTATAVAAGCRTNVDDSGPIRVGNGSIRVRNGPPLPTGITRIFGGKIDGYAGRSSLPARPAPNTRFAAPGGIVLTLNKQVIRKDGELTVDAVYASLLGGAQKLVIGHVGCTPPPPV